MSGIGLLMNFQRLDETNSRCWRFEEQLALEVEAAGMEAGHSIPCLASMDDVEVPWYRSQVHQHFRG